MSNNLQAAINPGILVCIPSGYTTLEILCTQFRLSENNDVNIFSVTCFEASGQ